MDTTPRPLASVEASKKRKAPAPTRDSNNAAKNGRFEKRVKLHEARRIAVQASDAALKDGQLDLQAFLNVREFEIKALEEGIRKTKAAAATRAFQKVPRAMRRRTASHNVKRIPKRLRAKARHEQMVDNTPTVEARKRRPRTTRARIRAETAKKLGELAERKRKRQLKKAAEKDAASADHGSVPTEATVHTRPAQPKIRRNRLNDPPKARSKFKKRQVNKAWLPTHLWHAKRARMTDPARPLWRFAVPLTPTEKCYRPTHRASTREGAVAWDTSYMSTIGLYGSHTGIERVLKALGLAQASAWGARGQKWRAGSRKWSGHLSRQRRGLSGVIGPATILWNPEQPSEPERDRQRQVFIRTHPSCFHELFEELLKLVKMQSPQLYIEDLRFQIGSIEMTGPDSTEALLGVLHPYYKKPSTEIKEPHALLFESLQGVTNPASLPSDAVLEFSVMDPRLRYPHRTLQGVGHGGEKGPIETLAQWPAEEGLLPSALFLKSARSRASSLPSEKAISRRRGTKPPGKELGVTAADPPIPIILFASRRSAGGQAQGTWTLLVPWDCVLPIWHSLMHYPLSTGNNPRFGGLDELRQVSFENNLPWFPADFPGTVAGSAWELKQREQRERAWGRRPKGKRIEWKTLQLGAGRKGEVGDGLACDFELLFGLSEDKPAETPEEGREKMEIDESRAGVMADDGKKEGTPDDLGSLAAVNHLPKQTFATLLDSANHDSPPEHSLITVGLHLVGRGVADACARIYRLPTSTIDALPPTQTEVPASAPPVVKGSLPSDLREQWLRMLPSKIQRASSRQGPKVTSRLLHARPLTSDMDLGGYPLCPDEGDLLGFVTTGAYNLSDGKSTAIGSISARRALETLQNNDRKEGHLCVVRNAGESVGWLARWELV
ncbi:POPLD-domain-containing protein [Thozetella sp. PMI_491]|nr:POPLD-domain-containing protein [Thozetella sp. PMI_491]